MLACVLALVGTTAGNAQPVQSIAVSHPVEQNTLVLQMTEVDLSAERLPPLVVLLGGSDGGLWFGQIGVDLTRAGYSTLSLSYFGHELQSSHLIERPLEPIADALAQARRSRNAHNRCIAIIGASKGGELALLLAAYSGELSINNTPLADAYVAASPSHVVWQSPHITLRSRSSWSIAGEPLDFVPHPWLSRHLPDVFFDRWRVGRYLQDALQNERAVSRAMIPVENITQPTLMLAGELDEMWPSADMVRAANARLERRAPTAPVSADIRQLNHFVLSDEDARATAITFISETLSASIAGGQCDADLPQGP
ncbi:acyl-CoA thioester hydrolase/BAAT C-terminal domain-containing protein [Maricaulis parjimensis]|uniref:acyl-CoA thioester hydrolase/BAAT C-terminal domain-containing protein n=1 Tax=Maricaulis parjimensis TaxID=144023 RepID=UPI00193996B2|nr:acyl-CoA thioester hydrolase/BAAT C-terminal domain-containing protein [Maricaulis parjimensis]